MEQLRSRFGLQVNLGEVHFPFVDGEINPNGVIFERLDESYNVIPGQDLLYWDDSNITITEGCDPNRYTASNPLKNVYTGLSSNSNGHKWGSTVTSAPFEGDVVLRRTLTTVMENRISEMAGF